MAGNVFFSSRRRHTRSYGDWSSDVCSSDLGGRQRAVVLPAPDGFNPIRDTIAMPLLLLMGIVGLILRSEERRVGKECRTRWSPGQLNNKRERRTQLRKRRSAGCSAHKHRQD